VPAGRRPARRLAAVQRRLDVPGRVPPPSGGDVRRFRGVHQVPRVEFWQGRPNRMHDRLVYERSGGEWRLKRLAP
jgi:pyridoxamine 5'-phosphate oxidase